MLQFLSGRGKVRERRTIGLCKVGIRVEQDRLQLDGPVLLVVGPFTFQHRLEETELVAWRTFDIKHANQLGVEHLDRTFEPEIAGRNRLVGAIGLGRLDFDDKVLAAHLFGLEAKADAFRFAQGLNLDLGPGQLFLIAGIVL